MDLRKKILSLNEGLDIYSQLLQDEETILIPFAISQYVTVCRIDELLPEYLADLRRNECKESLCIDFDQMTSVDYWMKKLVKLRSDMERLGTVPMKEHGFVVTVLGFSPETTIDLYRAIEQKVMQMVALLKQVEAMLKAAPPVLYQNFYRNLRAQYCEEQAVKDFGDWLMHSGKISLCKLKSFRAQTIAEYVNSGILRCALEPSEEEKSQVDVEEIKSQLPSSYPYEEWFDNCYAIFCRTVSWEGHILVPDYSCAGLFIFQNWDKLTEKDIQAIFHLDKMLELIHEKMLQLNDDIVPELPDVLVAPEAMVRAVEQTMTQGYWWANTSWAIVYRVYQMKGYKGSISQFEREIKTWPWKKELVFPCTYDGIQKPLSSGKLTRTIDKWEEDGASKQMINLGEALLNYLK